MGDDPGPVVDPPLVPDTPAPVDVPVTEPVLPPVDDRPVPVPDQVAPVVAAEPAAAVPQLTDREPLADIQVRLRRETDERMRGGKLRRQV